MRRALRASNIALGLGVAFTAAILYFIAYALRKSTAWNGIFNSIAASLTAALVFTLADYVLSRREYAEYIERLGNTVITELKSLEFQSNAVANARGMGLVQVFPFDRDDECSRVQDKMIREAPSLTLLMNRGATWVELHKEAFRERFTDPTKSTVIFFPNPQEPFFAIQAEKEETSVDELERKQVSTIRMLNDLSPDKQGGSYEVYGHKFFNPCLVILTDTEAIISPYYASEGRKKPPAMWFKKTSGEDDYYSRLRDDVYALRGSRGSVDLRPFFDYKLRPTHTTGDANLKVAGRH